jgi:hypothetical protein
VKETIALWAAHKEQYEESATACNPLVYAARLWLGKRGNVGREVSPATLFIEMSAIFRDLDLKFSYVSTAAFGKHLKANESSLAVLGFERVGRRAGQMCVFHPTPTEVIVCATLYTDSMNASSRTASAAWGSPDDDTSDLNAQPYTKKEIVQ